MSDNTRIYFAYGSNMSIRRLRERVPSARPLGIGWLPGHKLMFHKKSKDGSGKCDIVPSRAYTVFGVLFEIDSSEEVRLDRFEGLNDGYFKTECNARVAAGRYMSAFTYYADPKRVDAELKPYAWYLNHVIIGAEEASLPDAYVQKIRATKSIPDSNQQEKCERKLYERGESARWRQQEDSLEHPRLVSGAPPLILERDAGLE